MRARIHWRLSGMMALLYAVQGAFWPLLAVHLRDLGIDGRGRGGSSPRWRWGRSRCRWGRGNWSIA